MYHECLYSDTKEAVEEEEEEETQRHQRSYIYRVFDSSG